MASALLLSILGLSAGLSHCPMWRQLAPCTCRLATNNITEVACDRMASFDQVVRLLDGQFAPQDRVALKVRHSGMEDLRFRNFRELNMSIVNLALNHDGLSALDASTFAELATVKILSLADNNLEEVPEHLWKHLPALRTIDLGRTRIRAIRSSSFKDVPLMALMLPGNALSEMDQDSFPKQMQKLHVGRNNLRTLNKTLTNLSELNWLFANQNNITDLEGELPHDPKKLVLIHFSNNQIARLPSQMKTLTSLQSLFFLANNLRALEGNLANLRKLERIVLEHNQIHILTPEDFSGDDKLQSLILGHNQITSLNNSLLNLNNLNFLDMTYNLLTEFSFHEIAGLQELKSIDLSHNRIKTLIGTTANLVEWNIKLSELKLDHNYIETLNGALSGLPELLRLNLSHNRLTKISPDDLIGLDQLRLLDVSHNYLTTLEETSSTFLPRLEELVASDNFLTILEKDFHGLPVLCHADLSNNQIVALGRDLVSKTRCKVGHGVQEGTWDTLKIHLQDNPILCDAALPEIVSAMEINHTRITGVSHCAPLSEQPVTSKPNHFLGYIPEGAAVNRTEPVRSNEPGLAGNKSALDPVRQEKQLTKLASEIEQLRTRVEELANQNQKILNQQMPEKTTEVVEENRKP